MFNVTSYCQGLAGITLKPSQKEPLGFLFKLLFYLNKEELLINSFFKKEKGLSIKEFFVKRYVKFVISKN